MARVRNDNVFGTTTNNPLLVGGTTLNSAGLANLAAVSSAEAIIILDPNRVSGAPEIVVVTAHTGSATSATIQRGQFGTSAREHAAGTEWVHGPIASNASSYATAADDQGDYVPMNAWEAFTPTLTQSGAVTKTVNHARYVRIGRTIHAIYDLGVTGAGTVTNAVLVGLPVASVAMANAPHIGSMLIYDASTSTRYQGGAEWTTTTTFGLSITQASPSLWGIVPNLALASGDVIRVQITYEAAS